jgi:cytochrome c-type biogenesis protein CcmH
MIWLLGALVAMLAIAGVATPWWLPRFAQRRSLRRRAANVAAYRTRLAELEADVAAGVLTADGVESLREEIGARLVQDVEALAEPETGVAASRAPIVIGGVVLLAFAAVWYGLAETWRTQELIQLSRTDPEGARQAALNRSIADLRERVEERPDDPESWVWLARSYRSRGSFADAAAAFGKANDLRGRQDPDLLVEEGEALAQAQERSMAGAPAERFRQALALAPSHPQALWYAGIAAMQAGEDGAAIAHWEQLLQQPLAEDMRSVLEHSLARLRLRAGVPEPKAAATAKAPAAAQPAAGLQLQIEVSVAPALAGEIRPGDTLFVFATDPAGPPMPVAVQRLSAAQLPLRTTLDDGNNLMQGRKLSSLERWRVVARVSRSGNATPQPGDLEGAAEVGRADAKAVRIVIDRKRP